MANNKKPIISTEDTPELIGQIIDIFEDFLEEKGITIENDEREDSGEENDAIIYGTDYGTIQDELEATLKTWNIIA